MSGRGARPVYSTDKGRACARCGWPEKECRCAQNFDQAVPEKIEVVLRKETGGRGGKTVTVVDRLPRNKTFVQALAAELKKALGTGGAALDTSIEIQGDHRDVLRRRLQAKGWRVKG